MSGRASIWCCTVFLVALLATLHSGVAIESRCSACKAVAYELQKRLDKENPTAVTTKKFSELRMIELFEDLCKNMYHYTLGKKDDKTSGKQYPAWMKVSGESTIVIDGAVTLGGPETGHRGREIEHYCGKLVEALEDDLMQSLRKDMHKNGGTEDMLCRVLTNHCGTLAKPITKGEDTVNDEL